MSTRTGTPPSRSPSRDDPFTSGPPDHGLAARSGPYDGRDSIRWPQSAPEAPLWDPDNLTVSPTGEIYVAEDAGDLRISLIAPPDDAGQRVITPFLQLDRAEHEGSELTGPCFDPAGARLYFSSQRGGTTGQGVTYEITGPFAAVAPAPDRPPKGGRGKGRPGGPPGRRPPG